MRYAAVRIAPVLSVAPEPLDAVDVVAPHGPPLLLADHDMVSDETQADISLATRRRSRVAGRRVLADAAQDLGG